MGGVLLAALAAALLAACGSSSPTKGGGTTDGGGTTAGCTPTTCTAQGKNCGTLSDGCGGTLACGDCAAGQSCGAGGTPNVCGAGAALSPSSAPVAVIAFDGTSALAPVPYAEQLDATSSSCGGSCAAYDWDFGDGSPHATAATVAHTYTAVGNYTVTLTVTDASGNTATATAPVAIVSPDRGSTRWAQVASGGGPAGDVWTGVSAADPQGNIYVTGFISAASGGANRLDKLTAAGAPVWSKSWPGPGVEMYGIVGSPFGDVYAWGGAGSFSGATIDLGAGPIAYPFLVRYHSDGSYGGLVDSCTQGNCVAFGAVTDGRGDFADSYVPALTGGGSRFGRDGGSFQFPWAQSYVMDSDGNLAMAVHVSAPYTFGGQTFGHPDNSPSAWLGKLDKNGQWLWLEEVPGAPELLAWGTTAAGTVVASGYTGAAGTSWASSTLGANVPFLLVAEAGGQPRWIRQTDVYVNRAAVDPIGQIALASEAAGCQVTFEKYDLGGNALWARTIQTDAACQPVHVDAITVSGNHDVIAVGNFAGRVDFGTIQPSAVTVDAYVLVLKP